MAEIFKNPELIITPSVNAPSAGGKEHTGNSEIDAYINSLPEDEREEALLAITAPKTGEEIHKEMNETGVDPNKEDWLKLNQFYRTKDTDYLKSISESASHIYDIFGHAMASVAKDPSLENLGTVTPSVFEGAIQNLRGLYGIAAESVDSTSAQAKFFNILNGRTEDSDESYRVFLEARNFARESQELADGKKTILFDKHHLNNEFVQAAALVADPLMFVPFGKAFTLAGGMLGMSERSMALAARTANIKNKILGGAIKYGAGMPIEFIGKGTRVTLDHAIATGEKAFMAATGVSSETFREGMRMSGVGSLGAGYFGHSVPLLTTASGAYVAGTAAAGVGEALSVIGHQMMKGERGIASYARQALKDSAKQGVELSGHSKALLKIIDGFDPLIDYTTTVAQGAAHGSVIGAGLGYWSGGEEGMAQGIGAGIALGSVGGTAGRLLADVTGRTYKHRTSIQAKLVIEGIRDLHPEQAQSWERAQAWAKARNFSIDGIIASKDTLHPNTHIEVLTRQEYARYLKENGLNPNTYDGKTFLKDGDQPLSLKSFEQQNGYVVENRANGTVKIYLNADAAPRATLGHELFHSILRNSVMKDYYAQAVKEKVIGTRNAEGNLTNKGVVDIREVKEMFRRYLDAEFKDPTERADAQARLEMAEKAYKDGGQMVADPALGGRPLLEHLSEEFGAYYFSHLVMDKPIDWLYHGGDLPGIRGVLDNAKSLYQNYWRSRMNLSAPEFDFSRTFIDANGVEKLVPIDEVFAPATRDMFGNITGNTKRVVNPAMDLFFRDMLRIEKKVNETGQFDITKMDKQTQQRYIDSEGLDGVFTKDQFGNYQHSTEAQIKRENRVKGKAVYQLLLAIPEAERTFVIDADGNIRGHLTPQMLDNIVNSGHMTRAMANKISLFQSIARGEAAGNVVDFGGIGGTAERPMDVNNPSRMYGGRVPYKSRTAVVFGLDTVIGKDGKFQFKGNMLDYKVIETRANNEWSNAEVRSLWNGNHTEYLADFYRYLENASKAHDDATRVPSAELWTDGKGAERRNVLHQVLGMAKGEADTFLNSPKAEINRNAYSTVMSFSLNRMTNLRLRSQSVPFKFENAYRDLVRNWSPAEMDSELTPRGKIFKHPSGFRFVQREDGKTDAFDEQNKRIGTYQTAAEATEAGRRHALKHPSTVLLKDNMTDNTVINRSPNEGEGELSTSRFRVPREEPRFQDSIEYNELFALPWNTKPWFDPLRFDSLVKNGTDFFTAPDPKRHTLWQYLDYHQKAKTPVTLGDVLRFITEQGKSIHPNVPRDYHSKYAELLLSVGAGLEHLPVNITSDGHWTGGSKGANMATKHSSRHIREATFAERYEHFKQQYKNAPTEELKRIIQEMERQDKARRKALAESKENKPEEETQEETQDGDQNKTKKEPEYDLPVIEFIEKKGHQQMNLNLAQLVDALWASNNKEGSTFGNDSRGNYGREYVRRQRAMEGQSFEGTALEEIGHALLSFSELAAIRADPELGKLIQNFNEADQTGLKGVAWKRGVEKFLEDTAMKIKSGIILPEPVIAWARLLALQKHAIEQTFVVHDKSPQRPISLWDADKAIILNDSVNTAKGKPKSGRGHLKDGWRVVAPWEFVNYKGTREFEIPMDGKRYYNPTRTSVYRLMSTAEFSITMLNDPDTITRWLSMPFEPLLFERLGLETDKVKQGFPERLADLHNQMAEGVKQFTEHDTGFVYQHLEEVIRTLSSTKPDGWDLPKRVNLQNEIGKPSSERPVRPSGYLSKYETAWVNDARVNMKIWSEAHKKKNPFEGLSNWEIWEKTLSNTIEGLDEAMGRPKSDWKINAKPVKESEIKGVLVGEMTLRDEKTGEPTGTFSLLRGGETQVVGKGKKQKTLVYNVDVGWVTEGYTKKNQRVGRWDEEKKRWVPIDEEGSTQPIQETPAEHKTVIDEEGNTVIIDEEGNPVIDDETGKPVIIDEEGQTVIIDDEGNKVPVEVPPPVVPVPPVPPVPLVPPVPPVPPVPKTTPKTTPTQPVPPAPIPKRDFTQADIRVWRSWKTETYGNSSALKNALGYVIMSLNKNYRVYNPQRVLLGIYKDEEDAKRRVQREEPKR